MRVTLQQIAEGAAAYAENEILPKMKDDKTAQIMLSVGINALRANPGYLDKIVNKGVMQTLLDPDEAGTYEIDGLYHAVKDSLDKYGAYPVVLPPIPILSPTEKTMKFDAEDIEALRKYIERSGR